MISHHHMRNLDPASQSLWQKEHLPSIYHPEPNCESENAGCCWCGKVCCSTHSSKWTFGSHGSLTIRWWLLWKRSLTDLKHLGLSSLGGAHVEMQHSERDTKGLVWNKGFARQDLDAARYLVLHRISIKKETLHRQWGISTMGHVIIEDGGRL